MAAKKEKAPKDLRPVFINLAFIGTLLLLWQFLLVDRPTVQGINAGIESLTGWDPDFRALSVLNFPKPATILGQLFITPENGNGGLGFFWFHASQTLNSALFGFFTGNLIAILVAILFFYVPVVEKAFMPFALAMRSIPLVAVLPLLLRVRFMMADLPAVKETPVLNMVFGTEMAVKMLIVIIVVFFPTLINVYQGLRSTSPSALELMDSINASGWHTFWKLRLPSALPLTFSAFKITASLALFGVVLSEWLASQSGLGFLMINASQSAMLRPADLWVAMLIVTVASVGLYYLVSFFERIAIPWHESVAALKEAMEGSQVTAGEETTL